MFDGVPAKNRKRAIQKWVALIICALHVQTSVAHLRYMRDKLPLAEKNRRKKERDRLYHQIHRDARRAYLRQWRAAHLAESRGYDVKRDRLRKIESRSRVLSHYGSQCACCGETLERFLTVDHVENDGAAHRKQLGGQSKAGHHIYFWLIRNKFPEGFQILCYNCNFGKYLNGGICPHKTARLLATDDKLSDRRAILTCEAGLLASRP